MLRLTHLSLALVFAGLVAAGGCTVGAPSTGFGQDTGTKKTDGDDMGGTGTQTPTGDMAPPLTPPSPSTFSQTSVWMTVPIHGTTSPPNSAVLIMAMDGSTTSAEVDGSGSFCANLVLQANKTNTFQLWTHDVNSGKDSASVSIQVTQAGQPNQGTSTQDSENAALGGAATNQYIGQAGTAPAQQVVDGDPTTWLEASYTPGTYFSSPLPMVWVKLNATSNINKIIARLPSDCALANPMKLYYSALDAPAPPGDGVAGWNPVTAVQTSDGLTVQASFGTVQASWIGAVWTGAGNLVYEFNGGGCGSLGNTFGLAELEAWTVPGIAQPPQTAPMCGL